MSAIALVLGGLFALYVLVGVANERAYQRYGFVPLTMANLMPASLLLALVLFGMQYISMAHLKDAALQSSLWTAAYGLSALVAVWRFAVNVRQTNALVGVLAAAGHVVYGWVLCLFFVWLSDIYSRNGAGGLMLAILGCFFVANLVRGRVYHITTRYSDGSVTRSEVRTHD